MAAGNRHNPKRARTSESTYSLMEFMREFPDDATCLEWLWRNRYSEDGEHAYCPRCEKERSFKRYATKQARQSWTCTGCGHHLQPTAGTIFHKSSTSLQLWFYAMYIITSTRCGISAKQLERELGVTYKTAWRMFNLIRNQLMTQADEPLSGKVEADETFMGGKPRAYPKQPKNWHWARKPIVFGAVERQGEIRATIIPNSSGPTMTKAMHRFVLPGVTLFTDDAGWYRSMHKHYEHRRINHSAAIYVDGDVYTNTIEGFFGLLKNGIRGTYHSVSRKWLQGYLNEYAWRYNRRGNGRAMFLDLLDESSSRAR